MDAHWLKLWRTWVTKSWPTPRTAAIGVQPNTLSWPLTKQASISRIQALLMPLCRRRVPALQAPCGHRGHLIPRKGQNKVSPGRGRWIATPLALAEAERSTNFVASRKDERTALSVEGVSGGFATPSASVLQLIPGMKQFRHQGSRLPLGPLDPREYMRQRRERRVERNTSADHEAKTWADRNGFALRVNNEGSVPIELAPRAEARSPTTAQIRGKI